MIERGIDLDTPFWHFYMRRNRDTTLLVFACQKSYSNVVQLLLENGVSTDYTIKDDGDYIFDRHPMCTAIKNKSLQILQLLIEHKMSLETVDFLYAATQYNFLEGAQLLLSIGAFTKSEIPDSLELANKQGFVKISELLQKNV